MATIKQLIAEYSKEVEKWEKDIKAMDLAIDDHGDYRATITRIHTYKQVIADLEILQTHLAKEIGNIPVDVEYSDLGNIIYMILGE